MNANMHVQLLLLADIVIFACCKIIELSLFVSLAC